MLVRDFTQQRELARLLHGAALLAHEEGDDGEAIARAREVLFVGRAADRLPPTLVAHLVSLGIRALGCDAVIQLAPDLNVGPAGGVGDAPPDGGAGRAAPRAQVSELIAELLDDAEPVEGLRRSLRGERVEFFDTIDAILQGRMGTAAGSAPLGGATAPSGVQLFFARPMFRRNAEAMARHVTALLAALDAPDWPTFDRRTAAPSAALATPSRSQFLVAMAAPSLHRGVEMSYRARADRRMAAVALAARLYALDHAGRLPATLDDLVPTYLPSVPRDPMAAGNRPLGYVADGDRPRVYNVGEDGADDGGNDPDPKLPRYERAQVADDVRYLKRQPRPATLRGDDEQIRARD